MRGSLDLIGHRRRGAKPVVGTIRLIAFVAAAAALMLFSTVATLFWYVIRLLMSLRSD